MKLVYRFIVLLLGSIIFNVTACHDKSIPDEEQMKLEQTVSLDETTLSMQVGKEVLLSAVFEEGVTPRRNYYWHSSDADIVSVVGQGDRNHQALLTARGEGRGRISYRSDDGELLAICDVQVMVNPDDIIEPDGIIRILAIGNSFSQDALEYYLHGLATANNMPVIIANMYISGASLSRHVEEMNKVDGESVYSYRKIGIDGVKTTVENASLTTALLDEPWDYVSFQQASSNSGQYETYVTPFPMLYNYVKSKLVKRPNVKYVFHQTWAYAQNSTHVGFAAYGNDQQNMYNAIINAVNQATNLVDIDLVVPAGTAIQNGRSSVVGDNFCRDGYHLEENIGRYTASCAWYETIFGQSVIGNTFKPAALSDFETEIAQHAAHFAVQTPNGITEMTDYQSWPNTGAPMRDVFVDFGKTSAVEGWNGFTGNVAGYRIENLRDKEGDATGISMELVTPFVAHGDNTTGCPATTTTQFDIPSAVSSTSGYGRPTTGNVELKLEGLDKDKMYDFCFFSSRMGVSDNRETSFTVEGESKKTVLSDATKNCSEIVCAGSIQPNNEGEITIQITSGPNNNNVTKLYYINAMRISLAD